MPGIRRVAADSVERLATALADAQVDLNAHQVEAALFAFRSPFSKRVILTVGAQWDLPGAVTAL